jgi:hypothetical protein
MYSRSPVAKQPIIAAVEGTPVDHIIEESDNPPEALLLELVGQYEK